MFLCVESIRYEMFCYRLLRSAVIVFLLHFIRLLLNYNQYFIRSVYMLLHIVFYTVAPVRRPEGIQMYD